MFTPLSEKEIEEIVSLQIDNIKKMLEKNGVTLEITPKALGLIAAEGYDPEFGARPVKRVIHRLILNQLSNTQRNPTETRYQPIIVDTENDQIVFRN